MAMNIVNCWSKAGIGSSTIVSFGDPDVNANSGHSSNGSTRIQSQNQRQLLVALDLGATPVFLDAIPASVVLITHGHIDHIGAIFSHARAHALSSNGSIPTYYIPNSILRLVNAACDAMAAVDACTYPRSNSPTFMNTTDSMGATATDTTIGYSATTSTASPSTKHRMKLNLVGVQHGDEFLLPVHKKSKTMEVVVQVFATSHASCPSVGYVIRTRRNLQRLKPQYIGLPGIELGKLVRSGTSIQEQWVEEKFQITYTGDTSVDALHKNAELWSKCHTIICEATYLDPSDKSRDLARDRGHMHIDDVVHLLKHHSAATKDADADADADTETGSRFVLMHISDRYTAEQALDFIVDVIPQQFLHQVGVAVRSLRGASNFTHISHSGGIVLLSAYQHFKLTSTRTQT